MNRLETIKMKGGVEYRLYNLYFYPKGRLKNVERVHQSVVKKVSHTTIEFLRDVLDFQDNAIPTLQEMKQYIKHVNPDCSLNNGVTLLENVWL